MTTAYVGLGANLGDRERTISSAVELLDSDPGVHVAAVSTLRETAPWGVVDQPPFLNGACEIETPLPASRLLALLLSVERALGRVRDGTRWGPRTIDLDLLLYGDEQIDEPGLTVPHPRLAERRFVLEPLAELRPGLVLPDGRSVAELLTQVQ